VGEVQTDLGFIKEGSDPLTYSHCCLAQSLVSHREIARHVKSVDLTQKLDCGLEQGDSESAKRQ